MVSTGYVILHMDILIPSCQQLKYSNNDLKISYMWYETRALGICLGMGSCTYIINPQTKDKSMAAGVQAKEDIYVYDG